MAIRIFHGFNGIKRCHQFPNFVNMNTCMRMQNKRYISGYFNALTHKPTMFLFAFGIATYGAAHLYSTIYGSYRDRAMVTAKEELATATTKAIDYYNSGDGHQKYDNWKQQRSEKKNKKKQDRAENMKENISDVLQLYNDKVKTKKE